MATKKINKQLEGIEQVLKEGGYILRLEKGNFTTGYCLLESRKVVVLNRFLDHEGRLNALLDLVPKLKLETIGMSSEAKQIYQRLLKENEGSTIFQEMVEQKLGLEEERSDEE